MSYNFIPKYKLLPLLLLLLITPALYLWPDFHPEKVITKQTFWWMDVLKHSGYFLIVSLSTLVLVPKKNPIIIAVVIFALSIALEFLQFFSNNHSVEIKDIVYNLIGVLLALGIYFFLKSKGMNNE